MNTLLSLAQVRRINKELKELNNILIEQEKEGLGKQRYTLGYVLKVMKARSWNDCQVIEIITEQKNAAQRYLDNHRQTLAKLAEQELINNLDKQKPMNNYHFSLAQVRKIYNKYNSVTTYYTFRELLIEAESKDLSMGNTITLISNIYNGYLEFEDFKNNDYFEFENNFYAHDRYVVTMEDDLIDYENAVMCEETEEYTCDPVTLRDGRHERTIARSVAREHYYVCAWDNDIYYSQDGIEYYGYYVNDDNEVTDEPPSDEYVREYHSNTSTKYLIFDDNNLYRIGFEIEKEDNYIKESIDIDSFEYETDNKWRKEEDGSLSDYSGYELVSPCFSLDPEAIREYIEDNDTLIDHINANYSDNCGGHINLSKKGLTGEEFYETIKGYTPLIHALNYDRLNEHYCTPASTNKLKQDKRKYQSIAIWDNRIELRIFSAVESVDQLIWRAELMHLICDNPTDCFKTAFYNCHTVLKQHLYDGYCKNYFYDYDHFDLFIEEIIEQCKKHENIDLTNA